MAQPMMVNQPGVMYIGGVPGAMPGSMPVYYPQQQHLYNCHFSIIEKPTADGPTHDGQPARRDVHWRRARSHAGVNARLLSSATTSI